MRILLLSTYELGHQPLGIARPAGALAGAGHEIRACDLAVESLDEGDLGWAEAIAISVPMHTALRLALQLIERIRYLRPTVPIALHGLYAPVAEGQAALGEHDLLVAGEVESALVTWAGALAPDVRSSAGAEPEAGGARAHTAAGVVIELGPARRRASGAGHVPDRTHLPSLDRYARLLTAGAEQDGLLAGYVEASHGCSHRCRHCPVPVVYQGRTRVIDPDTVLADVARLVGAGARHLTFGDPDFLNRPRHSLEIVRRVHAAHPFLTFDVTVKVEHILRHETIWPELAGAGCLFVVSALESVDDRVLGLLDKGHTRADAVRAISVLRRAGVEPRPSLLPFTPWTRIDDMVDLVCFVAEQDLVPNIDPVQYGIRLLLPPGSLLLEDPDPELAASLRAYDPNLLSWTWRSHDPQVDELQARIAALTEAASAAGATIESSYERVRREVFCAAGRDDRDAGTWRTGAPAGAGARPRLSEAWFCCAEPTGRQLAAVELP